MSRTESISSKLSHFTSKTSFIDLCVILAAIIFSLIVWLPTRYFPFHWDGAGFFNNAIENLIKTNLTPLIAAGSDFAHPPLLAAIYALAFNIFGKSMVIAHALMFPFLPIIIISVYYIGRKIASPLVGIIAAMLVGITPVILAEYGIVYIDLPSAALALAAIAFWIYHHRLISMIVLSLAILIKFTGLLLIPFIITLILVEYKKEKISLKQFLWLLIPIFAFVGWLIYHYSATQWWFTIPERSYHIPKTFTSLKNSAIYVLESLFISQGRWSLSLITLSLFLYTLAVGKIKQLAISKYTWSLLATIIFGFFFYTYSGEFAQRYAIVLYPMIYLFLLSLTQLLLKIISQDNYEYALAVIGILCSIIFIANWSPGKIPIQEYDFRPPSNLSYQDMMTVFRQASIFIEVMHHDSQIYGAFPENIYSTEVHQGYVSKPLSFTLCNNFEPQPNQEQIIYIHPYSPIQIQCRQLLDQFPAEPLSRFESGDKWLELYRITTATDSATSQE